MHPPEANLQTHSSPTNTVNAKVLIVLAILTVLGLAFRLLIAWAHLRGLPDDFSRLVGDETGYESIGWLCTQGAWFTWPGRAPAYPAFIAAVYACIGERSPAAVEYAQAVVSAAAVPLVFLLARRFMTVGWAALAAGIVALDPAVVYHVERLYTEAVYTPLLVATVLAMACAVSRPTIARLALAGIMLALLNFTRPAGTLLPALLLIAVPASWSIRQRIVRTAICFAAMGLCILPYTIHNYRLHHRFIPIASSTGVLWQGSPEWYHLVQEKHYLKIWEENLNPKWNGGHDPFTPDGGKYFASRARASIKAEPGVYLEYCMFKAAYFWFGNALTEWSYGAIMSRTTMSPYFSVQYWLGLVAARNVPWLGLLAVLVLLDRRQLWRYALPLAVICYFWAVHVVTFTEVRFSEPMHALLAVIIAGGAASLRRANAGLGTSHGAEK